MRKIAIGSFVAGAAVMYFADPSRGKRRRALARDKFLAGWHDVAHEMDKAGRDLRNRTQGAACAAKSLVKHVDPGDPVIVDRVRATIGRVVSHPHAIRARLDGPGRIVLEGPVLRHELDYLLKRVRSVAGVQEVASRLEIFNEAGGESSLQGGVPRRALHEVAQQNWTPSLRVAAGAAAGAAFYAGLRNDGPIRWAGAMTGAALLARAIANRPFRQLCGADGSADTLHFEKTIHIDAPVEEVYAFWSNFENFPKFMAHLKEVRQLANGRSHWVAGGPGGISVPWDAEVIDRQENRSLSWKSVPGSMIRSSGTVRFDSETDGRTRVSIRMSYCPPAGVFGHAIAWLFGTDPKNEMDDDLVRMKSLLELGRTHAHGAAITREQVAAGPAM